VSADVIPVPTPEFHLDINGSPAGIHARNANAGTQEWRPQVQQVPPVPLECFLQKHC
jgi:hypothetical protein